MQGLRIPFLKGFGKWMMTIGVNNITYGITGVNPMQEIIELSVDANSAELIYNGVDLASSGIGLGSKIPTVVDTAFFGNRVVYQSMLSQTSNYGLLIESLGTASNTYQIYEALENK